MRYTEVRMSKLAHELLADIDKETVDFVPNYDESETRTGRAADPGFKPPGQRLLGIAGSAMATNIPPAQPDGDPSRPACPAR